MGEGADDALDRELSMWEDECDDFVSPHPIRGPKPITCRGCGKTGLYWNKVSGRWRLFEPGMRNIHKCPKHPLKDIETLEDLEKFTHWKVGDGMKDSQRLPGDEPEGFIIGHIAIVEHEPKKFWIVYFDTQGRYRGKQAVKLDTEINLSKQ